MVLLLLFTLQAGADSVHAPQLTLLELRLALARRDQAYLEVHGDSIVVSIKGLEVRRFQVEDSEGLSTGEFSAADVQQRVPSPIVKLVEVPTEPDDKLGSVGSPEDRVSVSDMPENYYLILSDGSHWLVASGDWKAPSAALERWLIRSRASFSYLSHWSSRASARLFLTRLSPADAQNLYWIIQEGTGVIY